MAETFSELGLRPALVAAAEEAGWSRPSAVQRGAIPVLRRGGNVVLHATAGSGVVAAYGLGLLDRLAGSERRAHGGPRALVIVPSREAASHVAGSLARLASRVGLTVAGAGHGWATSETSADVVVLSIGGVLSRIQTSRLKLETLECLVLDGALAIAELFGWDAAESVFVTVPREAQRVITAEALTSGLDDFVERHARRALYVPPRTLPGAVEPRATRTGGAAAVEYVVAGREGKEDAVATLLGTSPAAGGALLHCRTAGEAEALAGELRLRGFDVAHETGAAAVRVSASTANAAELLVSYSVPLDADELAERHARGGVVLVEARELSHLRRIASEIGVTLESRTLPAAEPDGELERFRDALRQVARDEDLAPYVLSIEPLLAEMSPLEIAAAATRLLRRSMREPARPPEPAPTPATGAPPAWVRLFISVGARDQLRPGDLVGAITGEAGIPGSAVGRIEIRDTFSIAEVTSEHAERVLKALNGITLKGRSVRADYDRRRITPPTRRRAGGGA